MEFIYSFIVLKLFLTLLFWGATFYILQRSFKLERFKSLLIATIILVLVHDLIYPIVDQAFILEEVNNQLLKNNLRHLELGH